MKALEVKMKKIKKEIQLKSHVSMLTANEIEFLNAVIVFVTHVHIVSCVKCDNTGYI